MSPLDYTFEGGEKQRLGANGGEVVGPNGTRLIYYGDNIGSGHLVGPEIDGVRDTDSFLVREYGDKTAKLSVITRIVPRIEVNGEDTPIRTRVTVERS